MSSILNASRIIVQRSSRPALCSLPRNRRPARLARTYATESTPAIDPTEQPASEVVPAAEERNAEEVEPEDVEKTGTRVRRPRVSYSSSSKEPEPTVLPQGLDILWSPQESLCDMESTSALLPPPEILEEAWDNLLITLHPQNQYRAAYATGGSSRPVEPTLGLYCPIEGGDYVIDATVRELAFRTGAEVVVLDAVHLAAGEWGPFGKVANSLNLPRNPLHFTAPVQPPESPREQHSRSGDDEEEFEFPFQFSPPQRLAIAGLKPFFTPNRPLASSNSRRTTPPTKQELFFDALVNIPSTATSSPSSTQARPRIIYVRDYPTLAASSSTWYPALLNAVRQRRRGPLSRTSGGVSQPVTMIFGMTPPLLAPQETTSGPTNLMSLLMNRNALPSSVSYGGKHEHVSDWTESEAAELAREKRLKLRLRKWEKSPTGLQDELPRLPVEEEAASSSRPDVVIMGGAGGPSPLLNLPIGLPDGEAENDSSSQFFRSSVLLPSTRSSSLEKETRMARRREINELTVRMGVGAVGGSVEAGSACQALEYGDVGSSDASHPMWDDWGNRIEVWNNVRKIADRAMGSMLATQQPFPKDSTGMEATPVPWDAVEAAWAAQNTVKHTRRAWLKQSGTVRPAFEDDAVPEAADAQQELDKIIESVKNDPDLEPHEQRLLSCIVNAASIPTTFKQVHLPEHTIDSVRTIVSLPLLHPDAFRHGILKDHSMTGCLLFGPPGTGKTLVVRALAKEAGCRMLAISPSDVMDMYVGEGEKLVRAVFSLARRLSPCVVFLDEIDALFGARMSARESGGAIAHRGVITEFMQEMDGLKSSKEDNVIVIGATNRPFDLDDAVLRRLPRRLMVDLPREVDRQEILRILLRDEVLGHDVTVEALAKRTDGFSGSDLKHLCVSAALDAVKERVDLPWQPRSVEVKVEVSVREGDVTAEDKATPPADSALLATPTMAAVIPTTTPTTDASADASTYSYRLIALRNFEKALKEITPSSSESLGSLSELRKWNDEFGEGRRDKKLQVWGKDRFGFILRDPSVVVAKPQTAALPSAPSSS